MKNRLIHSLLAIAALLYGAPVSSQVYRQDPAFQSALVKKNNGYVSSFIKVSDSKILVTGGMDYVNYTVTSPPIRLTENGSVDDSFSFTPGGGDSFFVVRQDGKLVGRDLYEGANSEPYVHLTLYQPNGKLEATFSTNIKSASVIIPQALAVQANNKVIVGTVITQENYDYKGLINRVETDGRIDRTFSTAHLDIRWLNQIVVQADGKILVSGSFGPKGEFRKTLIRLHADGLLDDGFNPPVNMFGGLSSVTMLEAGKILLGTGRGVVRLLPTGELDDSFNINEYAVSATALQPDGKILVGHWVSDTINYVTGHGPVIRLNSDGSVDTSFEASPGAANFSVSALEVQSDGHILVGGHFDRFSGQPAVGIVRLDGTDGQIDPAFSIKLESRGYLDQTVTQPDSKLLVFGDFNSVNDQSSNDLVRLRADGSIDSSFNIGTGVDGFWDLNGGFVRSVALQQDRKIIVGGFFSSFNQVFANSLVRLNEDGSVDPSFKKFELEKYYVNAVAVQQDGKILVGGAAYYGEEGEFVIRLLPDGSRDPDFVTASGRGFVGQILVQEDGKILVGGGFNNYNNASANHLVRLNTDGTIDPTFRAIGSDSPVEKLVLQDDGKILVQGRFTQFNNVLVSSFVRLNTDGIIDDTFSAELSTYPQIHDFVLRSDGQLLVSGYLFQTADKLVLLRGNGSLNDEISVEEPDPIFYSSMTSIGDKLLVASGNNLIQLCAGRQSRVGEDQVLGTESEVSTSVKVYPNPASDHINIESLLFLSSKPNPSVVLYDLNGRRRPISITPTIAGYRLEFNRLSRGLYFLHVTTEDKKLIRKVVLE